MLAARTPGNDWSAIKGDFSASLPSGLFSGAVHPGPQSVTEADEILRGRFRLFSWKPVDAGFPPLWQNHPLSGVRMPAEPHWTAIREGAAGDVKLVWELSRFGWAFPLARAYARTKDERYAEAFWTLFDDWLQQNQPNHGPQWMCGQEATFRLMAATYACSVLRSAGATSAERLKRFARFVGVTGGRIEGNLEYALHQSNNHGVSECVGLITASLLMPTLAEAGRWRRRGFAELQRQLAELVYSDGGFSQHSANYHRVLLQDLLWLTVLLRAFEQAVPEWIIESGRRALRFIAALLNTTTGRVPLIGANDGAHVLPLADGDYWDFRPLVQAGACALFGERWLGEGPWDEAASWLTGQPITSLPYLPLEEMPTRLWPNAGLAQIRSGEVRALLRCPTRFRHRPSQADMLNVEIEWRGYAVLLDPGTYSYGRTDQKMPDLNWARAHSTIVFDEAEPMAKVSRFLYLPWPKGTVRVQGNGFEATHDGWEKIGARHRRKISTPARNTVIIEDELSSQRQLRARVHWLLPDVVYELEAEKATLVLATPVGKWSIRWETPTGAVVTLVRADKSSSRGWWAPNYLQLEPALSLAIEFDFTGNAAVRTQFAPA